MIWHHIKSLILREWQLTVAELYPSELWRLMWQGFKDTIKDFKELVKEADNNRGG